LAALLAAAETQKRPDIGSDIRALCGVMGTWDAGTHDLLDLLLVA
jgi:hypothetical protein